MNTNNSSFNTTEAGPSTIPTSAHLKNTFELKNQAAFRSEKDEIKQYSMKISAETTSNAKILGFKVKDFIVGHGLTVKINVKNIGCNFPDPDDKITIRIHWPNGQIVEKQVAFKKLQHKNEEGTFNTESLCRGFALFTVEDKTSDGKFISFFREDDTQIKPNESFHSLLAKEAQELYTLYALYFSAASLSFLVIDRILWWALRP